MLMFFLNSRFSASQVPNPNDVIPVKTESMKSNSQFRKVPTRNVHRVEAVLIIASHVQVMVFMMFSRLTFRCESSPNNIIPAEAGIHEDFKLNLKINLLTQTN